MDIFFDALVGVPFFALALIALILFAMVLLVNKLYPKPKRAPVHPHTCTSCNPRSRK